MGSLVPITGKLEKLIPRLGTEADGEIVATVRAIGRALQSNGCDWHDLAAALKVRPEPQPTAYERPRQRYQSRDTDLERFLHMARFLRDYRAERLNEKCRRFVTAMANDLAAGQSISTKQKRFLEDLYTQNGGTQ
ncbi:hypothetical protein JT55_10250 [Rhodovulum sp. NI22]|nr:hypothetical protein JT55_10250 [Rhodovulum sp. NI22]